MTVKRDSAKRIEPLRRQNMARIFAVDRDDMLKSRCGSIRTIARFLLRARVRVNECAWARRRTRSKSMRICEKPPYTAIQNRNKVEEQNLHQNGREHYITLDIMNLYGTLQSFIMEER